MTRQTFLLLTAIASLGFGLLMFLAPVFGAELLGMDPTPQILSVLRGLGGLIIGSAVINWFLRNATEPSIVRSLLLTNIVTHALGLAADLWGVADGALTITKMVPVECTHLFVGIGSLVYLLRLKSNVGATA